MSPTDPEPQPDRTVVVLFFDGVEELDAIGPWEALAVWASHFASSPTRMVAASFDGEPVRCSNGLRIAVDAALDEVGRIDLLVQPGGPGADALQTDVPHLERLVTLHDGGSLITSVCTGAHVLAAAGLLRDRPATTHHHTLEAFARLDPSIEVRGAERVVDAGEVVTSAGVSAGIDMALHLIARLESQRAADEVRSVLQWNPTLGEGARNSTTHQATLC